MTSRVLCRLLCVAVSMATLCQGARIVFTATPTTISSGVTQSFALRCALENDGGSSVTRVSNIAIRKVEGPIQRDVAKITYGGQAVAGSWAVGATVTGQLPDKTGYLQATWSSPGQLQAGGYNCEIVALETDGTDIKFKSNIQVTSTGQGFHDLTTSLAESKAEIEALKNSFSDLKANTAQRQSEISESKNRVRDLNTNIGRLSTSHSEQGSVVCSNSDNWGAKGVHRENVQQVRFSTPYSKIPLVFISLVRLDVVRDSNTRYQFAIKDLTTTGFKIVCATWHYTVIWDMEVRWTSIVG